MTESLHEMAIRMRNEKCRCDCTDCEQKDRPCFIGALCRVDNADDQIKTLKNWVREHPRKTWLDLLREKLPDSVYARDYSRRPPQCPSDIFGNEAGKVYGGASRCGYGGTCEDCWNSEVDE